MSEEPANMVLEYLRRIDGRLGRIEIRMTEMESRLTSLEGHYLTLRKDLLHTQEDVARLTVAFEGIRGDVSAIQRRLDMAEA